MRAGPCSAGNRWGSDRVDLRNAGPIGCIWLGMKIITLSALLACLAALGLPVSGQRARHSAPPLDPITPRTSPFMDPHELIRRPASTAVYDGLLCTSASVTGDLDGDGDLDMVTCEALDWEYYDALPSRVYLNDGDGVLNLHRKALPDDPHGAPDIGLGDLDGDGDLDLVFPILDHFFSSVLEPRLYLNDGNATFADASSGLPPIGATGFQYGVELGDVDGDGDLDILWESAGSGSRLHLNDGTAGFVEAPLSPNSRNSRFGDVDGDGDLDFVNGGDILYLNNGAGVFSGLGLQGGFSEFAQLGDLDGDGDLDIGAFEFVKLNNGPGQFTLHQTTPRTGPVALVDVEGDGDLDMLGVERLMLNDGSATFFTAFGQLPPFTQSIRTQAAGDYDGDGDVDLLVPVHWANGGLYGLADTYFLLNDGAGTFADSRVWTEELRRYTDYDDGCRWYYDNPCVFFGDVNADGFDDVLSAYAEGQLQYHLNDGTGRFAAPVPFPPDPAVINDLEVLDLDGDGDNDVLFTGGGIRWFRNDGLSFTIQGTGVGAYTESLDVGDIDGDGDPDVIGANGRLLLNDGSGSFAISNLHLGGREVKLFDLEADGDLDILFRHTRLLLLVNDGAGAFTEEGVARIPSGNLDTLDVGDVDGDGDVDILIGAAQSRLLLNNGAGFFGEASDRLGVRPNAQRVFLVDVDGDGHLDVTLGSIGLRNDGTGRFDERFVFGSYFGPLAYSDIDGDGDQDLVYDNQYWDDPDLDPAVNTTRQIAWHAPPKVGAELRIDVYGPPGEPWILSYASAPAHIPSSYGTAFLDPASLTRAGVGTLNRRGKASFRMQIPADPALIGTTLHWQALVGAQPRFTNRETTPFTSF